jgi:3-oxoacyl-[acyl-carrier protein] reductase
LITGSSQGTGAATARLFAWEGAKVALHGRDSNALSQVAAEIRSAGGNIMQVVGDVTNFSEIEAMRIMIEETFRPVDILVVNAGRNLSMPSSLEGISEQDWCATVDSILTSAFFTIKSFLPSMKERKSGNIITISSTAARRPTAMSPIPYTASKAGIQLLT